MADPGSRGERVPRRIPRYSQLAPLLRPRPFDIDATRRRLTAAATISDLRLIARRVSPRAVFDYVDGGAGDEFSLRRSRAAYARVEFRPRVLRDVSTADATTPLLGHPSALPIVFAPTGFTRMLHHQGEPAVARVAGRTGIPYVLSTMGTTSPERLAEAAPGTRRWFQLYLWRDRDKSRELLRRAAANGYDALILTVDTAVSGPRLRDVRNGMTIPPSLTLRTFLNGLRHPAWWFNLLTTEPLEFASFSSWQGTVSDFANRIFDPTVTVGDLAWLREEWTGPLLVKGVTTVEDAEAVVAAGAEGVIISNHGGRQLDRAPVPLEQLPAIAAAVGDRAEVYVDGGVMSGSDVAAAVCLGARAVLVGRAYLYGLMAGGERGVQRAADILTDEFLMTMRLLGTTTVADLTPDRALLRDR